MNKILAFLFFALVSCVEPTIATSSVPVRQSDLMIIDQVKIGNNHLTEVYDKKNRIRCYTFHATFGSSAVGISCVRETL